MKMQSLHGKHPWQESCWGIIVSYLSVSAIDLGSKCRANKNKTHHVWKLEMLFSIVVYSARVRAICRAIRVRCECSAFSKKERARGDDVLWQVDPTNTVGVIVRGSFKPKFNYDTVFRDTSDNREVYNTVASNVVSTAMNGINGTIFAYGVTSSGKTHTMMGNEAQPGIVPQSICQVCQQDRRCNLA